MKKVISKGYTLSVTSWENDGDNYRTESITIDNKELAIAVARMCKELFASSNNGEGGIGNLMEDDDKKAKKIILSYMKAHPELYPKIRNNKKISDDKLIRICMEYNCDLMGGSEYYYSRVFDSFSLTYAPEDIFLEEISI